jgi:hypothetical protein
MFEEDNNLSEEVKLVKYVLDQIIDNKDEMYINRTEDEMGTLLTICVAEDEMGKIIGKKGRFIQALRTITKILGSKLGKKIHLKVIHPNER